MDGALSSDRHSGGYRHDRYGGGGGGGGGYRHDRGGGYGGGGGHRRRGGGRGRRTHHPYRHGGDRYGGGRGGGGGGGGYRGGRGRGPRQPANRFSTETKSVDPQYAMKKQLTAMVAKMGDLAGAAEVASASTSTSAGVGDTGAGDGDTGVNALRPVVKAVGTNVSDLVEVLCGPANAPLFLKFGSDPLKNEEQENTEGEATDNLDKETSEEKPTKIDAAAEAGGLATLLLHCASNLPLQTPSYAALTLGVDAKAPETHAGFARRCVDLAVRTLGRDLDLMLECTPTTTTASSNNDKGGDKGGDKGEGTGGTVEEQVALLKSKEDQRCHAETSGGYGNGGQIDAYYRAKLTLRYLAHLATIGIVALDDGEGSLVGLLEALSEAASRAVHHTAAQGTAGEDENSRAYSRAAHLLASLVLSTIPYLLQPSVRHRLAAMADALETNVIGAGAGYVSNYAPGAGPNAILLQGELDDVAVGAMEEEEEESDDEEEGEGPAPCADTLQDLLRTVRALISADGGGGTRFALPTDAPWRALTTVVPPAEGAGGMDGEASSPERVPLTYEGEPLTLDLLGGDGGRCTSLPHLLSLDTYSEGAAEVRCRSTEGMVYGRLALFDAPPSPEDEDEEEEEEGGKETNPNLDAYVRTYSLADRCLLSDAVRDVVACHRPMVSDAGAERNTAREAAEHVWAVSHLFAPAGDADVATATSPEGGEAPATTTPNDDASRGVEYGIVETLLSLVAQATPPGASTPAASPPTSHLYLSRVLLELTKLQPTRIAHAIVMAVAGLFNDFVPSLTSTARENLGAWLAFHLVNTGFQWPTAYWEHWAPYVSAIAHGGRNSRGEFVQAVLWTMAASSSDGAATMVRDCLPAGSALVPSVFLQQLQNGQEEDVAAAERDLVHRFWSAADDPDAVRQYFISDELSESYGGGNSGAMDNAGHAMDHASVWWRTRLAARALFYPLKRESVRMARATERAWRARSAAEGDGAAPGDDDGAMDEEGDESEDALADVSDAISRFKPVLLAALARDADAYDSVASGKVDDDALLLAGEASILDEFGGILQSWDVSLGSALIECLMRNKVVSGMAVARWACELDEGSARANWWSYVALALGSSIREALSQMEASRTDLGGGIGMIVDETGQGEEDPAETAAQRLDEALKASVPILKYVAERVCGIVAASTSEKKVPPVGADAVEGMKRLVDALLFHFHSNVLGQGSILTAANVQKGFASMGADGEKLASECQAFMSACQNEPGKKLLQSLSSSLGRMI